MLGSRKNLPPVAAPAGKSGAPKPLSRDPGKAILEMMETIKDLHNVYILETAALEKIDTQAFLALQDEKAQKARQYQSNVEEMVSRKEEIRDVEPDLKQKLEQMQRDFFQLTQKNMDALKRMQRTMDRLGGTLRKAAKEAAKKQRITGYSETGALRDNDEKRISISLSETA